MKAKLWIKYFIYMSLILIVVFWGQHVFVVYKQNAQKTFGFRPYYNILMIIFYGSIGLLLGLEHLIYQIRKQGKWSVNFPKVVLMVIPSLYFSLALFIYYNNITLLSFPLKGIIENGTNFINAFQIILGYSIITSFYKDESNNRNISIT